MSFILVTTFAAIGGIYLIWFADELGGTVRRSVAR